MTWEQEMKIQSEIRAKKIAKEMAPKMAEEIGQKIAEEMAEKKAIETAKNLLENGVAVELVAKCTGLSLEEVLNLQKEV